MRDYVTRTTTRTVLPAGETIFSEMATQIKIVDEAAGEFVKIEQERGAINVNEKEWKIIRGEVDDMFKVIREAEKQKGKP